MKKNRDKGFTLVELIVVIVILAILIGVTIGGIYMYVGKARYNTDVNNAKAMEDVLSATFLSDNDGVCSKLMSEYKNYCGGFVWRAEIPKSEFWDNYWIQEAKKASGGTKYYADIISECEQLFDVLPESKTKKGFCIKLEYPDGAEVPTLSVIPLCTVDEIRIGYTSNTVDFLLKGL